MMPNDTLPSIGTDTKHSAGDTLDDMLPLHGIEVMGSSSTSIYSLRECKPVSPAVETQGGGSISVCGLTNSIRNGSRTSTMWGAASTAARQLAEQVAGQDLRFHPLILCPLLNVGNTCYFNAGIQLFANCPAFVYGLRDSPFLHPRGQDLARLLCHSGGPRVHNFYVALGKLLHGMENAELRPGEALQPINALRCLAVMHPDFEGSSQQDCPELVNVVLSNIGDEGCITADVRQLLSTFDRKLVESTRCPLQANTTMDKRVAKATAAADSARLATEVETERSIGVLREDAAQHLKAESTRAASEELLVHKPLSTSPEIPMWPHSLHHLLLYQVMVQVHEENTALEALARQRERKPPAPPSHFPRLLLNPVTDGFKGYTLSEIQCHTCGNISRVVESFTSIILDIPTERQRADYAKRHPNVCRLAPNGSLLQPKRPTFCWWDPLAYIGRFINIISRMDVFSATVNFPLTLEECLDIHFEAEELKGSNRYQCESCGQLSNATKTVAFLSLPEYLLLHMKRFKVGTCFQSKKTDPVIFPVSWTPLSAEAAQEPAIPGEQPEVLHMWHYVHPSVREHYAGLPPLLRTHRPSSTSGNPNGHAISSYTLDAVVNHHGSYGGGHYTAYIHKVASQKDMWVYMNDEDVAQASMEELADSEEYLLLYRKQPMVMPSEKVSVLRNKARYYLLEQRLSSNNSSRDEVREGNAMYAPDRCEKVGATSVPVYISRAWLQRMAFLQDPGPILNELCYCPEEDTTRVATHASLFSGNANVSNQQPHVHGPPVEWFYVPIDPLDYAAFHGMYGGSSALSQQRYEQLQREQEVFARRILQMKQAHAASTGKMPY